jgi:hypothetical protein
MSGDFTRPAAGRFAPCRLGEAAWRSLRSALDRWLRRASSPARESSSTRPDALKRLATLGSPELQVALVREALELLEPGDRDVLGGRLGGDSLRVADGSAYGVAIDRFTARLSWVAAREASGVPPAQRRVLGRLRFSGLGAHAIADQLRLPLEVVEYWARLAAARPE